MDYGIGIKNKFDLFVDIEDPDFILINSKNKGHQKTTTDKKPLQKSNVTEKNAKVTIKSAQPVKAAATTQKSTVAQTNDVRARQNDTRDRRADKGNRNEKRSGGKEGGRPGKREFDRKSGSDKSGVKPTEKREGFGKSNWGNFAEDETAQTETPAEQNNEEEALNHANEEIENVEPVEEPKVLTLEEYRKQEQEKRLVPKYNIRKPGEGDTQQWKKGYVLKKENEEEEHIVVYEEIEVEETKHNKHKKVLDIDITFREDRKPGPGFRRDRRDGDRRGDRGDRPPRRDFGDRRGDRPPRDREDRGDRPPREDRKRNSEADGEQREEGSGKPFRGGFRRNNEDGEHRGDREDRPRGFRRNNEDGEHRGDREDRPRGFRRNNEDGERGEHRGERRDRRPPRTDREGDDKEHRERGPREDRPPRDRDNRRRNDRPPRGDRNDHDESRGDRPPRRSGQGFRKGGKSAPKFDDLNDLAQFPSLGLGSAKVES